MKKNIKPLILVDANLLAWMSGFYDNKNPKKFNLNKEKEAFKKLKEMKLRGEIGLAILDKHLENFKNSQNNKLQNLEIVAKCFDKILSLIENIIFRNSELEEYVRMAYKAIYDGQEKQDDPSIFVNVNFIDYSITHVASCDKLEIKFKIYEDRLSRHNELIKYRDFRRKGVKVFAGRPTEVLENLKSLKP
jgi:hypothetical protein